jgi:hypothetical protein
MATINLLVAGLWGLYNLLVTGLWRINILVAGLWRWKRFNTLAGGSPVDAPQSLRSPLEDGGGEEDAGGGGGGGSSMQAASGNLLHPPFLSCIAPSSPPGAAQLTPVMCRLRAVNYDL